MTLEDWLKTTGTDRRAFAQRIGTAKATVDRYIAGNRIPERETMRKIVAETAGEVRADDFFGTVGEYPRSVIG